METNGKLRKVCTIAPTPFTEEDEVGLAGVDSLAQHYLLAGVHGAVLK